MATAGIGVALKASSYNKIIGANDRVSVAYMGLGRRVNAYLPSLDKQYNTELLYLCDVKKSQVTSLQSKISNLGYTPKVNDDIRKILEDKNLDAVFVAAPDHWHTPASCLAMDAGKHVYVEKPCAHNPREGELLVAYQKRTGQVVQMGNQQRSSLHTIEIIKDIHNGVIGKPYKAIAFYNNGRKEVPHPVKQSPPEDLNWDLFQGPAPRQEYHHDIWNYNWHWYGWNWGTAETGNNAVHELDVARWAMQVDYPENVNVKAEKQHYPSDGWEMYDTMYASFKYPDQKEICWDGKCRNNFNTYGAGRGTIIYGTEGTVFVNRSYYKLFDRSGKLIRESEKTNESGTALGGGGDSSTAHVQNFMDAIRGKSNLNAPISDAAISNHLALLANIAYRTDKSFDIDTSTGRAYDKDAMQLWSRDYAPGWEIK